jgi:uncharacterized protein
MELGEVMSLDQGLSEWCILLGYRGSIAHGMYIPNTDPDSIDDIDLMGIVTPPLDYYMGLKEYGSRGTREIKQEEWDIVVYETKKFIRLLAQGNPNVLSLLWLEPEDYIQVSKAGQFLIDNRKIFMCKHIYNSFVGYAHSQLSRMTKFSTQGYMGEKRKKLVEKWGWDLKNGAHLIRLLRMGTEALSTGELQVKRKDRDELLSIKRGEWSLEKVQETANELFAICERAKDNSTLPDKPDFDVVNKLCFDAILLGRD